MDHDMEESTSAPTAAELSWEEAKGLCEEISAVFDNGLKDGQRLFQIKSKYEGLRTALNDQQKSARQTVTDMMAEIQRIQQYEDERDNSEEMLRRIQDLDRLKHELQHKLHELKEEQLVSEANIENLIAQYDLAQQRYTEECAAREKDIPRLKQTIALYASITGIKWDFASEHIAGNIHVPERKHVESFELKEPHNAFDVANELWRLIDDVHKV
ncbi:hypothetical protein LEN26_009198 [Aphanomyces euteiches]|nr:hypothetical protein AeMF1_007375 [Aphanomyces euteiches]KAH9120499.1 hypothetical protein AeMF1_007384 [Aphanomyces euteiches]KAH9127796.1 hypothetical protein LEN26_009198 [Aphanomyces euteiches]KAH9193015.1 hypothetical protein AeNC1_005015 [Aphanomyces euteiches]